MSELADFTFGLLYNNDNIDVIINNLSCLSDKKQ